MTKKTIGVFLLTILSSTASFAFISEQIDDHKASRCVGDQVRVTIEGELAEVFVTNSIGEEVKLSGELLSLTIDTTEGSINHRVALDGNPYRFRYLTISTVSGDSAFALHYDISTVAGGLGDGFCAIDWKE